MKLDKLSWSDLVREAQEKQLPLADYLLERSAAQAELEPAQLLEEMCIRDSPDSLCPVADPSGSGDDLWPGPRGDGMA